MEMNEGFFYYKITIVRDKIPHYDTTITILNKVTCT